MEGIQISKLFIIGNGFDIGHGLKTEYNHFRDHLLEKFDVSSSSMDSDFFYEVPAIEMHPKRGYIINHSEIVEFLVRIISEGLREVNQPESDEEEDKIVDWNNFEKALARLPLEHCFEDTEVTSRDEGEDSPHYGRTLANQEQRAKDIEESISQLEEYFEGWLRGIEEKIDEVNRKKEGFATLCCRESFFLTFNYTKTLEVVYKISEEQVCHIHGKINDTSELVFGHGEELILQESNIEYEETPIQDCCGSILNKFRKDTTKWIDEHEEFFCDLENAGESIHQIYSYGFSFSQVDIPYIEKICQILPPTGVTWFLHDYNLDQKELEFQEILRKAGFRGEFRSFCC